MQPAEKPKNLGIFGEKENIAANTVCGKNHDILVNVYN